MLFVQATLAVAECKIALEALGVAHAVVLLAVVRLTVASAAHGGAQKRNLLLACLNCPLTVVVLAASALAGFAAGNAVFEANAVPLMARALLTMARLTLHRDFDSCNICRRLLLFLRLIMQVRGKLLLCLNVRVYRICLRQLCDS